MSTGGCRLLRFSVQIVLLVFVMAPVTASGQPQKEFWPETDLWLRVSPTWRLSMFIALSKNIETAYREGNLLLQGDYSWGRRTFLYNLPWLDTSRTQDVKAFLARGGILQGTSLGDRGEAYRERTLFLELHSRNPIRGAILLSQRLRVDLRWLGEPSEFSSRVRYRLMLEKDYQIGSLAIIPYVNVEPYFDSRYSIVNRVRLCGGAACGWVPEFAIEGNVTYQYDSRMSVHHILALNIILHGFFAPWSPS